VPVSRLLPPLLLLPPLPLLPLPLPPLLLHLPLLLLLLPGRGRGSDNRGAGANLLSSSSKLVAAFLLPQPLEFSLGLATLVSQPCTRRW
jgi:hypothetical protein